MPLVPLKLPAGFRSIGTDLEASGRWIDGSLVRFLGGSLRPIKGWRERINAAVAAVPRGMHAWKDENDSEHIVVGTYNGLYAISRANIVSDITPAGLVSGRQIAEVEDGYGGGYYGTSYYGIPRPDEGVYSPATQWHLDNWGQYLVACSTDDGKIYEWQLNTATPAQQIANAPVGCRGVMVTEERFLFALGADGDPRKIAWCDQENNTLWTPASTNQAGSQILQTSGEIMTAVRVQGSTLTLTTSDAHRSVYVGAPFIYQTERAGTSCGIISPKAVAVVDQGAFWMGDNAFYHFNGSSVSVLPCEVADKVFVGMNDLQRSQVWAVANGMNSEIWWFYCSEGSNMNDRYVAFNYGEGVWTFGELSRTTGVDDGVFDFPMWFGADGSLYEHEIGYNYDGAEVFAETGPFYIGSGERTFNITKLFPDETNQGDVVASFKTRLYPNAAETTHGPYTLTAPTSVRLSGRQVRMRVTGNALGPWRVGIMRVMGSDGGRR